MGFSIGIFAFMGIAFVVIGIVLLVSSRKQNNKQKGAMEISATVVDRDEYKTRRIRHSAGGAQRRAPVHGTSTVVINTYEYNDPQTGELKRTKNKWSTSEIKQQKIGDKVKIYVTPNGEALPPDNTKTTKLAAGILFIVLGMIFVLGILAVFYIIEQLNSIPFQS